MGSNNKTRQSAPQTATLQPGGPPWIVIGGALALAALVTFALYPSSTSESTGTSIAEAAPAREAVPAPTSTEHPSGAPTAPTAQASPVPDATQPLPPLPLVPNMVARPPEVVRDAYVFAAYNPDVLEFVPCFCGCETAGHKANADCFVESRNPDGSVRTWDTHGMACAVCVDVARDSMRLRSSGASVRDVRTAIEAKYAQYTRRTPTPPAPH